tara:strand:- start:3250 stop:11991 length:8742 start_codon:yes stop_codon:yes gene_type:complete
MPDRVDLPDGTYIDIPDDMTNEARIELQKMIDNEFGTSHHQTLYTGLQGGPTRSSASSPIEESGGTLLGSAWEGIKSIPRGARQFGLMAAQGWEGIRTPDEDTDREKELRQRMEDLMMEIDPRYRDSNLVNVGMGLGQVAGMMGIGGTASLLGAGAVGATAITGAATALMGAGEQSSRIAEFEESTGQDVSAAKEVMAMGMGLGIGLSEVALGPMAKFGKAIGVAKRSGAPLRQVLADQGENVIERGLVGSVLRQAGEEALQEGAAGFAQSATARALYDDQALVGGGAAALKEALIGGQVGGVVEASTKLLTRAYAGRRGAQIRRLLGKKYEEKLANGEFDTQDINDLLQDLDEDTELGARNRELRDSVVRRDEDTGEFVVHEDEAGLIAQNNQKFVEENDRLHDKYLNGEISWETYTEASDQLIERSGNLKRELEILAATYNAQAKGLLDRGPQQITPSMAPPPVTDEPNVEALAPSVTTDGRDLVDNVKAVLRRSDDDIEIDARETIQRRINEQRTVQTEQRAKIKQQEEKIAYQEAQLARRQELEAAVEDTVIVTPANTEAGSRVSHPEYGLGEVVQSGQPVLVPQLDEKGNPKRDKNDRLLTQNRLVGRVVNHKSLGQGVVTDVKGGGVSVKFGDDKPKRIKADFLTDAETNESLEAELETQQNAGRLMVQFDNEAEPRVVSTLTSGDLTSAEMQDRLETLRADGKRKGSIRRANLNLTNLRKKFLKKLGEEQGSGVIENTNVGASRQQSPNKQQAERLDLIEQAQAELETARQAVENLRSEEQRILNNLRAGISKNPLTAVPVQGRARQESSQEIADIVERIEQVRNGPWRGAATEAEVVNIQREAVALQVEQQLLRNEGRPETDPELQAINDRLMELEATLNVLDQQDSRGLLESQTAFDSFVIPEGLRYKDFESATDRTLSTKDPSGLNAKGKKLAENFGVDEAQMLATIKEYRATRDRVESLQKELEVLDAQLNELDPSIQLASDRVTLSQQQQELETIQNEELFPELEGVETTLTGIESELADPDSRSDTPLLLLRKQFEQLRKQEDAADLTALEERLATAEQRQALRGLLDLARTEGGMPALSPRQVKRYVQDILSGGVLVRPTPVLEIESLVGEPIKKRIPRRKGRVDPSKPLTKRQEAEQLHSSVRNSWLYGDTRTPTPLALDSEQAGLDAAEKVIYHTLGIGSLMEIADGLENSGAYDKPVPDNWVGPSFGQLGKAEFINFRKKLEKAKYEITAEHIFELLKLKGIPAPFGNLANFERSPFFRDLVFTTVADPDTDLIADVKWKDLAEGEKQAVLARVLNTPSRLRVDQEGVLTYAVGRVGDPALRDQAKRTLAGSVDEVAVRVESDYNVRIEGNYARIDDGQLGPFKSEQQKLEQAEGLEEARQRIERFKTAVEKRLRKMKITAIPMFTANVDGVYAQIEDVIANGTFEYETDPNTGRVKPKLDSNGRVIYRPGYEDGAVASLRNHGTRIMYNISQIEAKYGKDWDTKMDEIVRDLTVHEGAHIHFLRDLLTETERKSLEKFGKKEGYVPASVSQEAHNKKLTWRQYVKELYPELSEAALTEETSVHILEALASGKLAASKTAGIIGKIKRTQLGIFSAIFQSAAEADINSVMQVFERTQNVDLMKSRQKRKADQKGLASLRLVERADPEDLRALRKAVKENNQQQIDEISDRILLKRQEFSDERSPMQRLQESLMTELRARRQIEGNPSNVIEPILNAKAIEAGEIDIDSLNAYFRFRDGREPPFVMPTGEADKRSWRIKFQKSLFALSGKTVDMLDNTKSDGGYVDTGTSAAEAIIEKLDAHNEYVSKKTGKKVRIKTEKDWKEMMQQSGKERFVTRFFDQRIPMLKSQIRERKRRAELASELGDYESALQMLSDQVAISAWRWADNAMNFVSMIVSQGPLQYSNGGFSLNKEAYGREAAGRGDIPVKALKDIEAPLLQVERGQEMASRYLNALRVRDVKTEVHKAELELQAAELEFELLGDPNADRSKIIKQRAIVQEWQSLYERANPVAGYVEVDGERRPYRLLPERTVENEKGDTIMGYPETIEFFQEGTDQEHELVREFAEEWADLNAHMIQFAVDTGMLSQDRADILKNMAFVPFYRDQGYDNDTMLYNPDNRTVQESNREAANDDPVLRGQILLNKAIQGSVAPISQDLFANLRANVSGIVRDGMRNVAMTRTIRDELRNGTAIEVIRPSLQELNRQKFVNEQITKLRKKGARRTAQEETLFNDLQLEKVGLDEVIAEKQKAFKKQERELNLAGFSSIEVMVQGVQPEAVMQLDENGNPVHEGRPMAEQGETKIYRVVDPALSQAMMDIGFSPMQAIEDFFGKTLGISPKFSHGLAKLLVGSSRFLRETVTRSPPFMLKNIMRDAMQASVIYGGNPFVLAGKIIKNTVTPGLVEQAEARGLGIAVDQAFDEADGRTSVRANWDSQIPIVGSVWNTLGRMGKQSEVATRMAVYDMALAKTDGNAAEALTQAIEIMNYGRRGSSRMFATIAAMSPFLNGRMQGLSVLVRNHLGSLDSPGIMMGEDGMALDPKVEERLRRQQALMRGSLIMLATLGYYLMMRDDEEYKNAREDTKNDWWLIPLGRDEEGKTRLGFKIPIPFEVGLIYKVIPEQMFRAISEEEHDFVDVGSEAFRQLKNTLFMDMRPQLIRPMLDAMSNRDAFQRDQIVPSWMENSVAASEQYNPYTNMMARLIGDKLENIPVLNKMSALTSPMKLEYMMRQYTGTIGAYGMAMADRVAREVMDENIAGTSADFGFSQDTFAQMPMLGDLFYSTVKGGGYQEDFYETMEQMDHLITTMGQIEDSEGGVAALQYKEENIGMFRHKRRLQYFDRRMKRYREQRDRVFNRPDLSKDEKRRMLHRMFEQRDDMLSDMLRIMAEIRRDRSATERLFGVEP